ncbi:MAG TPA: hypothetical protein P5256_06355 [Beijerinckiaceae bacterium]|nr:hypothetical protein [Rhodoblastus sp.]MCC2106132.1 hypothetical protein [Hyphomicrobiales bacterium]HRY02725.1 hypothetical protein [Beijerinckiaceae bacterium]
MKTDVVTKLRAGASLRTQKTAAAEIERLRALVPAWRDIASAPRDNQTVFLAFCPPKRRNKKIRPGDEHLYIHKCGYDDINDCWFEPDSFDSLKPTHWTPMLGLPS